MAFVDFLDRKILHKSLRLNWHVFSQPNFIYISILKAQKKLKIIFFLVTVGLVISIGFFTWGIYLSITKEVAVSGGEVREAILNEDVKNFNPLLTPNSDAESRITQLLFHPLYIIKSPNFAQSSSEDASIEPVLLEKSPEWAITTVEQTYTKLVFTLKSNLKWSNNKSITLDDIEYSFNRLKEKGANSDFYSSFNQVTFERLADTQFALNSSVSNPSLLYFANFSPVSKDYFEGKSIDKLIADFRSTKPTVTSGYFTFTSAQVPDPDDDKKPLRDNPIRSDTQDTFDTIYLDKNPQQNYQGVYIQKYIIRRFTKLNDSGGSESKSLEYAVKNGKVDLFIRNLLPADLVQSKDIKNTSKLNQDIIPTNTYYSIFLNLKVPGYQSTSLNSTLRKFVLCTISKNLTSTSESNTTIIEQNKQIIPLQLNTFTTPSCEGDDASWLDSRIFSIQKDDKQGIREVIQNAYGSQVRLSLLSPPNTETITSDIQRVLLDSGIATELVPTDSQNYREKILNHEYNFALIPVSVINRDLVPIYSVRGKDLSQISLNNSKQIIDRRFEDTLSRYYKSNMSDSDAKKQLVDLFAQEFTSMTLFQSRIEINYAERVQNLRPSKNTLNTTSDIYTTLPQWHTKTERVFK
jgi:ABC-type transport system substrate-binding protein